MNWKDERKSLFLMVGVFLACFFIPLDGGWFENAIKSSLHLLQWYAREHVILCLIPAFFIAGAIGVFLNQSSVMKYLGAGANKFWAYGVASVSGTILAVCSCTVLPLFSGIYRMGAGLGPAIAFLYSGPAINIMAILLTARVLGIKMGVARAVGAILFSIVIGLLMHFIFRKEEMEKKAQSSMMPESSDDNPLWKTSFHFFILIAILIFATWGKPIEKSGLWYSIFSFKWELTSLFSVILGGILIAWFKVDWWKVLLVAAPVVLLAFISHNPLLSFSAGIIGFSIITSKDTGKCGEWFSSSWGFAKQILPLLFWGVIAAGLFFGEPNGGGLIPSEWVAGMVGGNSFLSNLFASVVGVFMYFATLTEIPILQGLMNSGMGDGPALALLLAGPALSLPNMLVIRSILGTKKTIVFVLLVVIMSTFTGMIYGSFFPLKERKRL